MLMLDLDDNEYDYDFDFIHFQAILTLHLPVPWYQERAWLCQTVSTQLYKYTYCD